MKILSFINVAVYAVLLSSASAQVKISISPSNYVEVVAGRSITLRATVTGATNPSYKWTRSVFTGVVTGVDFDHSGDSAVGTDSATYTIPDPQEDDSRYYWVDIKDTNWATYDPNGYKDAKTYIDVVAMPNPVIVMVNPNDVVCAVGTSGHAMRGDGGGKNAANKWTIDSGTTDVGDPISPTYCDIDTSKVGVFTYKYTGSNIAGTRTASQVIQVVAKPTITKQPADKMIQVGSTGTLTMSAVANRATYNWYFNDLKGDYKDVPLNDGVSNIGTNTYTVDAVNTNWSGYYHVVIKNVAGSVTSSPALVIVGDFPQPTVARDPASTNLITGGTLNLSVVGTGDPLDYQWYKGSAAIAGATSNSYSLPNTKTTDSGAYFAVLSNPSGSATSAVATVMIMNSPAITKNLTDKVAAVGTNVTFSVTASNPNGVYIWFFSSGGSPTVLSSTTNSISINNVQYSDEGSYWVVLSNAVTSVSSKVASLSVLKAPGFNPNLTCDDGVVSGKTNTVPKGTTLHLSVGPEGDSLAYFWYQDTKLISTAATNLLVVTPTNSGKFSLVLTNLMGKVTSSNVVVTVIGPPVISTQPKTQSIVIGQKLTLSVTATGTRPYTNLVYQWAQGASAIDGATNATLTLTNAGSNAEGSYSVVITNFGGAVTSKTAVITMKADTNAPILMVTIPTKPLTNDSYNLPGTATDNVSISNVVFILNGTTNFAASVTNNYAKWSAGVTNLSLGSNKIVVIALDINGNTTAKTNTLIYNPIFAAALDYAGTGTGTVSGWTNRMQYGTTYTVTAKPGARNLFANWIGVSGLLFTTNTITTNSITLKITPTNTVAATANFATNLFFDVAGTYNGLFYDTNGVTHETAGFLTVTVTTNLGYSGKAQIAGKTISLSGQVAANGTAAISLSTNGDLSFTLNAQSQSLTGSVSLASVYTADLYADLAVFGKKNLASNFAGSYTIVIPPAVDGPADKGFGYATVTVSTNGTITLVGAAAGGAVLSQTVPISANGNWPLFVGLYSTTKSNYNGELMGWLNFATNGFASNIGPAGNVTWLKTAYTNAGIYASGFTNDVTILSSPFSMASAKATQVLPNFSLGTIWLTGGDLTDDLGAWIFINKAGDAYVYEPSTTVTFDKTGVVKAKFQHNGTGKPATAVGAVLQNSNRAFGYFIGTNSFGSLQIDPYDPLKL